MNSTSILLADDHHLFRLSLKLLLKKNQAFNVVGEASNGIEVLDWIKQNYCPDIIIMDVNMPEKNGIDTTYELKQSSDINVKVLALSMNSEYHYIDSMLKVGADGYITKSSSEDELNEAINNLIISNKKYFSQSVKEVMVNSFIDHDQVKFIDQNFSERELEVLKLVSAGLTNEEIAEQLFLSKRTIESHRRNMLNKTGLNNTAALIKYACDQKLI